jgi:hypothetical protein
VSFPSLNRGFDSLRPHPFFSLPNRNGREERRTKIIYKKVLAL